MNFSEALSLVKLGFSVKRPYWTGTCLKLGEYFDPAEPWAPSTLELVEAPIEGEKSYLKEPSSWVGHTGDLLAEDWLLVGEASTCRTRLERVLDEDHDRGLGVIS